ncbi:hypothetical protein EJ04DRAFT_564224 [Polyplosphaeria fusca]|uniref:CorA-like transporter domain-containing protein n=1 Tax=Polyplosphaeria fusca TaxID=682080 RepID=A0A9P4QVL0_9PLEO|nr:hypothetical protein EJ04DRAFT_564224 [Polyplosphaeria fusca]
MEQLRESCEKAASYPLNLVHPNAYRHTLNYYHSRLDSREKDLFRDQESSSVDILDLNFPEATFDNTTIKDVSTLKKHLWRDLEVDNLSIEEEKLPIRCRFVFMTAPNSHEKLDISREMMAYVFSYMQISPRFLDFVMSFGRTECVRSFPCSGFWQKNTIDDEVQALAIPELGRSGNEIMFCYILRGVESSKADPGLPWSIRPMAVHHTFDGETSNSQWVVVNASQIMKSSIESIMKSQKTPLVTDFKTVEETIHSYLTFHQLVSEWSAEGWQWYIDYLDDQLQSLTRHALAVPVEKPSATDVLTGEFSFSDLQKAQALGEKVHEAIFVLKSNDAVLSELKASFIIFIDEYSSKLQHSISVSQKNLRTQISRAECLFCLASDRKKLLYSILQYKNGKQSVPSPKRPRARLTP